MIPLPETSSPSTLRTRRISACEPLCARLGAGGRVCPPRGDSARTGRAPGRHKNDEYAAVTPARPAFQRHEAHAEGSDTTPMQERRKNAKQEFLLPPPTGLPPKPSEAVSAGRRRCSGVSEFSSAAATEMSDMQRVPPTASIAFVWSAAKPLPCQMHWAGHGPAPHFRAEAHTPQLRVFLRKRFYPPPAAQLQRGDQSPFEESPALRGDERNHFRKVIDYEKRYQIQHAHGVR